MKKPKHIIEKERARRQEGRERYWIFGLHAVRDALSNPLREKHRLLLTKNAANKLEDLLASLPITPEIEDPRRFSAPLDPASVHQGAALETAPLDRGSLSDHAEPEGSSLILALDRVSDPHNVGAILRSAEVFGARAVIAPERHSAPESGALAKTASGALERLPYLRIPNLARALDQLRDAHYHLIGLAGEAELPLEKILAHNSLKQGKEHRIVLILGAEGPGLRQLTREKCHNLARIEAFGSFGSLNVSNAAAISLYAARHEMNRSNNGE